MRDTNLVNALREHAEWARANEWETPITLGDDLTEAADQLENQNAHIAALQQEIEKLRGQNKQLREAAALVAKESAELLERRWIPVDGNLYPGDPNRAADGSGFNPFHTPAYVPNPAAPRNCCAGGFGSTKIGEEVENAETK